MNPIDILQNRLNPPLTQDGKTILSPVPIRHESALILSQLLKELRHINGPWLSPRRAADYVDVDVSQINRWKNAGELKAYYGPGMSHPRYKVTDLYTIMRNRIARKASSPNIIK
jgi:hypothetical protein